MKPESLQKVSNGLKLEELEEAFNAVMDEVFEERIRQNELWGEQNHEPDKWFSILMEEIGEAAESNNDKDMDNYRTECIQAAAVIVQMIECFDRNKEG